jgi:hypothetical protein
MHPSRLGRVSVQCVGHYRVRQKYRKCHYFVQPTVSGISGISGETNIQPQRSGRMKHGLSTRARAP